MIVSVDGGCTGVKNVARGMIAATSQQYPLKMAAMGVEAGVEYAKAGKKVVGLHRHRRDADHRPPDGRRREQGHPVRPRRVLGRQVAGPPA